jgi:hypothetical protein
LEDHKALQTTKAPDSSVVLERPMSLTTAWSRSNFLIILRLGTLITNSTSACYGDWDSALQPSWAHTLQGSLIESKSVHYQKKSQWFRKLWEPESHFPRIRRWFFLPPDSDWSIGVSTWFFPSRPLH